MKNKFAEFLNSIRSAMQQMTDRANEQIATLPPVEQHEAASLVLSVKSELNWQLKRFQEIANSEVIAKADSLFAALSDELVAERITAGLLVAADEHASLIEAARNGGIQAGRDEATTEFTATREREVLVTTRRAEVIAAVGTVDLAITDEVMAGEGYTSLIAALRDAVVIATEKGFTPEASPAGYRQILANALQGTAHRDAIIATLEEVRGVVPVAAAKTPITAGAAVPLVIAGKPEADGKSSFAVAKPY